MGYHHLALACKDIKAVHHFYEEIMEFELVKVEVGPVREGGWAKHFFYRMEDDSKFIAFWELHDVPDTENFDTNISRGVGLPDVFNHISFDVSDREDLERRRQRWLEAGLDVLEIDHNWCHSIYTRDPNENMVEFCLTTGKFDESDRKTALQALESVEPEFSKPPAKIDFISANGRG
jgi:catechol 2,3-dioxygenase-like lactoylglutathione lyase family enzyme